MLKKEWRAEEGVIAYTSASSIRGHLAEMKGWMFPFKSSFVLGGFTVDGSYSRLNADAETRKEVFLHLCEIMMHLEHECRKAGVLSITLTPVDSRAAALWARLGFVQQPNGSMTYEVAE